METLFRFSLARAAVEQDTDAPSISLSQATLLQDELRLLRGVSDSREKRRAAARDYLARTDFVADVADLDLGRQIEALGEVLDAAVAAAAVTPAGLRAAVTGAVGDIAVIVAGEPYATARRRLRDSILAIKVLPEAHRQPLHRLGRALRDLEVLQHLTVAAEFPADVRALRRFRRRSFAIDIGSGPAGVVASSILGAPASNAPRGDDEVKRRAESTAELGRLRALLNAVGELARVPADQLIRTPLADSREVMPPEDLRPLALFAQRVKSDRTAAAVVVPAGAGAKRGALTGRLALRAEDLSAAGFRLADAATTALSQATKTVLSSRGFEITRHPVDVMADALHVDVQASMTRLDQLAGTGFQRSLKRFGGALVLVKTPLLTDWGELIAGGAHDDKFPGRPAPPQQPVPSSHGTVAPAGVADLIVVKQQLLRYEGAEVAHIENVLQGERKERKHVRTRETEALTLRETEVSTSEERELQTTDRFEMSRETNATIREQAALAAGVTISGSYGMAVDFTAYAEGAFSRDREAAVRTAATFSKETTQRSASKIAERVLQRESLKVTTEVMEENSHLLDNVGGAGHIRGVYQWVEKVYEAQMFNYGLRMIYDITIPEPAAFLIATLERGHATAVELEKPTRFTLRPSQLTEYNYQAWVVEYGATDVVPAPERYLTRSLDYSAGGGDESSNYNHSAQIAIDDGYRAIHASVGVVGNVWDDGASVEVVIGQRANRIVHEGRRVWHTDLDNERATIPFALNSFRHADIAVAVEVKLQRTDTAIAKWCQDTHAKLTTAYRARLAEYEEKLAEIKAEAGIAIRGSNPAANLELMNTEIRKACISILTDQHYDLFGAIETGANGLPQLDLAEVAAEGPYVRFFEQAFEWEHMTWLTYPYFWGRKSEWTDRLAFEDSDPLFTQFLKAGYCRAVVPVRPGFEGAVDHFMTFGEPWMGGPLPPISSPMYLPIADELAERLDRPGDEIPEGDPWEVRIPTNLVRLRDDGSLPVWVKAADGRWVPE